MSNDQRVTNYYKMRDIVIDRAVIQCSRRIIATSKEVDSIDAFKQTVSAHEAIVESLGYKSDLLYISDDVFDKLFGRPDVIEADYLIKKGDGHE